MSTGWSMTSPRSRPERSNGNNPVGDHAVGTVLGRGGRRSRLHQTDESGRGAPVANGEVLVHRRTDDFAEVALGCSADQAREVAHPWTCLDGVNALSRLQMAQHGGGDDR